MGVPQMHHIESAANSLQRPPSFGLPYPPPMGFGDDGKGLPPAPQHPPTGISWVHSTCAYVRLPSYNSVLKKEREAVSLYYRITKKNGILRR